LVAGCGFGLFKVLRRSTLMPLVPLLSHLPCSSFCVGGEPWAGGALIGLLARMFPPRCTCQTQHSLKSPLSNSGTNSQWPVPSNYIMPECLRHCLLSLVRSKVRFPKVDTGPVHSAQASGSVTSLTANWRLCLGVGLRLSAAISRTSSSPSENMPMILLSGGTRPAAVTPRVPHSFHHARPV